MRTYLFFAILSLLGAAVANHRGAAKAASTVIVSGTKGLALTIIEPVGHRQRFRSVAIPAPRGLIIRYRYDCRWTSARMTVVVARDRVAYGKISTLDVLARFQTPTRTRHTGTFSVQRGGRYRLAVSLFPSCSWFMQIFA